MAVEQVLTLLEWSGPSFVAAVVRDRPDHPDVVRILEGSVEVGRPLQRRTFSSLEDARAYAREVRKNPFDVWVDFDIQDEDEAGFAFLVLLGLRGQVGVSPSCFRALFVSMDSLQWRIFRQVAGDLTSCASVFHLSEGV